jgi:transcriptional regulator with XRE-family HTH domain
MMMKERIEMRLQELGKSARSLSLAAGLGPDGIRNVLRARSKYPRADTIAKIAQALDVSVAWLLGHEAAAGAPAPPDTPPSGGAELVAPAPDMLLDTLPEGAIDLHRARRVPLLRTSPHPDKDNRLCIEQAVVEYICCPPALQYVHGLYAFYMRGKSMWPRYQDGDLVFVSMFRPIRQGDDVVLYPHAPAWLNDLAGHGWRPPPGVSLQTESILLRRFVGMLDTDMVLEQMLPQKRVRIGQNKFAALHKVLTLKDILTGGF